jgi:hypothetical protein
MAGAPKGNRNAAKAKDWEMALRRALHSYEDETTKRGESLDAIAKRVVESAVKAGEWKAIEEIGNRLDGRPAQSMELSGHVANTAPEEMSEDELERIAAGGSAGAAEASQGTQEPPGVH